MLKKVICSVFTLYQLSSGGGSRILLQGPPPQAVPNPNPEPVIPTQQNPGNPNPGSPVDPVVMPPPPVIEPPPVVNIPAVVEPPPVIELPVVEPVDPVGVPPVDPSVNPPVDPSVNPPVDPSVNPPVDPVGVPPVTLPVIVDPVPSVPVDPVPQVDPIHVVPPNPVQILPPDGYRFGAFGQLCPLTPASLFNKCTQPNDIVSSESAVWCDRDGDCCMCATVECGPQCVTFYAGDSAAYGVSNIIVHGAPVGQGALIDCHGVEGCRGATIDGTHIVGVNCNGARSCQDTTMYILDPKAGFMIDCAGIEACDNLHIDIEFSGPPPQYMCDPSLEIKNIYQLSGIDCANTRACSNMHVTINNAGCNKVVLQNVECTQTESCDGAHFDLIGDIDIRNCQCGPSCDNAMGLAKCFQNLDRLLCPNPADCQGHIKEIVNPANNFEFICGNEFSCESSKFTITLNQDISKPAPITRFTSLILGGLNAGRDATFIFDNQQGIDIFTGLPIILELNRVECGGYASCDGLTVITGPNMFIGEFICASDACYGCTIKANANDPVGRPCDPNQITRPTPAPTTPAPTNPPPPPVVPVGPGQVPGNPMPPLLPPNMPPGQVPVNPTPVVPAPQVPIPPPGMIPINQSPVIPVPAPANPVPPIPVPQMPVPPNPANQPNPPNQANPAPQQPEIPPPPAPQTPQLPLGMIPVGPGVPAPPAGPI